MEYELDVVYHVDCNVGEVKEKLGDTVADLIVVDSPRCSMWSYSFDFLKRGGVLLQLAELDKEVENSAIDLSKFSLQAKIFNYDLLRCGSAVTDGDSFFAVFKGGATRTEDHSLVLPRYNNFSSSERNLVFGLYLVESFSSVGDLVIDPYAGSGTFGVASLLLGRRYLGFDDRSGRCEQANQRLDYVKSMHAAGFKLYLSPNDLNKVIYDLKDYGDVNPAAS